MSFNTRQATSTSTQVTSLVYSLAGIEDVLKSTVKRQLHCGIERGVWLNTVHGQTLVVVRDVNETDELKTAYGLC